MSERSKIVHVLDREPEAETDPLFKKSLLAMQATSLYVAKDSQFDAKNQELRWRSV